MFPSSHDPVLIEIRDAHEGEEKAQQQRETKAAHELLVESPPKHAKTQMRRWCLKSNKSNCTTGPLPVSKNSYIYHYIYHNNVKYKYVIKYMLKKLVGQKFGSKIQHCSCWPRCPSSPARPPCRLSKPSAVTPLALWNRLMWPSIWGYLKIISLKSLDSDLEKNSIALDIDNSYNDMIRTIVRVSQNRGIPKSSTWV